MQYLFDTCDETMIAIMLEYVTHYAFKYATVVNTVHRRTFNRNPAFSIYESCSHQLQLFDYSQVLVVSKQSIVKYPVLLIS